MKYDYKVILMNEGGNHLQSSSIDRLQQWFDDGWEYVDSIQQKGYEWSPVSVVIRKEKQVDPLN
jgi:hypothetical protein